MNIDAYSEDKLYVSLFVIDKMKGLGRGLRVWVWYSLDYYLGRI